MARDIILSIETDAPPSTVYEALTSAEGLAAFWTPSVEASAAVGATLRFGFEAAPVDLEVTIADLVPGSRVAWDVEGPWPYWGGTRVEWTLTDSRVVFTHRGWNEDQAEADFGSVALTWALVLQALKAYVESGVPAPALA